MKEWCLQVSEVLEQRQREIAAAVVARQYETHPEFWPKFGKQGREISLRDT